MEFVERPFIWDPRLIYALARWQVVSAGDVMQMPHRVVWKLYELLTDEWDQLPKNNRPGLS